jgi:predicted permease
MGLSAGAGAERVWGYLATGNYFDALGIQPALGRFFHAADDLRPGSSPLAVLSYASWQTRFQSDPQIVGKTIRINSLPYTVVGVAPRGFRGTELFYLPEIWVPMMMQAQIEASNPWLEERGTSNCWVIGRLLPGVSRAAAEANLNALAAALGKEYPATDEGWKLSLAKPGLVGDTLRAPAAAFFAGLMILAGLVLFAACANLACLLSARAADRFREMAIRVSIGAGRLRIVRQLLTEAVLLALMGGACGCALAAVLLRLLSHWHAPLDFPMQLEVDPDGRVLLFTLAVSTLTGLLFGAAPARQAWRLNPNQSLKGMPSEHKLRRKWAVRDLLLAFQVALCCVLVTASFVSLRGLAQAVGTRPGFEAAGASALSFDLGLAHYNLADGRDFQRRALDEVSRLPGARAAAYGNSIPLSIDQSTTTAFPEQASDRRAIKGIQAGYYQVSPGYFQALGTRLLAGRDFTWRDDRNVPRVAIVNEIFARKVVGTSQAVGRRFRLFSGTPIEIVGLVENGKYQTLTEQPRAAVFWPSAQSYNPTTVMIVRSSMNEARMAGQMQQAIRRLDPRLPVYDVGSMTQMLGGAFLPARAATVALVVFGMLAVMLALTGIYGLTSYSVSRRLREIGIRIALGAGSGQVLRPVLGRIGLLLAGGMAAGLAAGAAASQLLANVVYQATSRDPLVLAAVAVTMSAIALAAALGPARRALSLDPLQALRQE